VRGDGPGAVEVEAFFDRFVDAFATFDGRRVADLFAVPAVACSEDGTLVGLTTRDEVVDYYQAALDAYRIRGCVACQWSDLRMTSMGTRSLVAAVSWRLLGSDDRVVSAWRQSYCLLTTGGAAKCFAAASHAA